MAGSRTRAKINQQKSLDHRVFPRSTEMLKKSNDRKTSKKPHLKEFPNGHTLNNISNEISNIVLGYNLKYKISIYEPY